MMKLRAKTGDGEVGFSKDTLTGPFEQTAVPKFKTTDKDCNDSRPGPQQSEVPRHESSAGYSKRRNVLNILMNKFCEGKIRKEKINHPKN